MSAVCCVPIVLLASNSRSVLIWQQDYFGEHCAGKKCLVEEGTNKRRTRDGQATNKGRTSDGQATVCNCKAQEVEYLIASRQIL
jgi:hypothetical protein